VCSLVSESPLAIRAATMLVSRTITSQVPLDAAQTPAVRQLELNPRASKVLTNAGNKIHRCGDTAEAQPGIRTAELIFLALHQI
jgi:hypothetical protein